MVCTHFTLSAQNLVPNPGFEDHINCPVNYDHNYLVSLKELKYWENAHRGSCDYFHTCMLDFNLRRSKNSYLGAFQSPHSGSGYLGFLVFSTDTFYDMPDYREIPIIRLSGPLEKNFLYDVEFYINVADSSSFFINNLNLYFARELNEFIRSSATSEILVPGFETNGRMLTYDRYIANIDDWTGINLTYRAQGGEKYLIFGNLNKDQHTAFQTGKLLPSQGRYRKYCYYYIDDVFVGPKGSILSIDNLFPGNHFTLRNIHFRTASAELEESSFPELKKLSRFMMEKTEVEIAVIGHTDNEGDAIFNMRLSVDRARAVREYMANLGVDRSRIEVMGMGSGKPVSGNSTEEGRARNRRVEIRVKD